MNSPPAFLTHLLCIAFVVGLCAVVFAEVDQISCRSTYWALLRGSQTFIPIIGGSHLQTNSDQGTRRRSCCRKGGCWWQFVDWCVTSWIDLNLIIISSRYQHYISSWPGFSSSALEGFLLGPFWESTVLVDLFLSSMIHLKFHYDRLWKTSKQVLFFQWNCSKDINLRTLNSLFFLETFFLIKNKGTSRKINMEPENRSLEMENHLPNHHFQVLC